MGEDRWRETEVVVAGWEQGQPETRGRRWEKDGDEGNFLSGRSREMSSSNPAQVKIYPREHPPPRVSCHNIPLNPL